MGKKEYYTISLIILGSVSLNLLNWIPEPNYDDQIIYKYIGLVIYKGGVPYRDAFDNKPPLIFFYNALTWLTGYGLAWMLDTLLVLLATLLFYSLCKKNKVAWPWFLPLLFNLIIRNNLIAYGNGMTREFTAVFLLLFFCVMFYENAYKYFILGFLAALTFWMQQDAIITILPLVFYSLVTQRHSPARISRRIVYTAGGFGIITLPVILYFVFNHALIYLWNDSFFFNYDLPRHSPGLFAELRLIKRSIHDSEMEMAFYTSLVLGFAALLLTRKKNGLLIIALLTLMLSFSAEFLTGRMQIGPGYLHYLLPLSASIPILVFVIFTETDISFLNDQFARVTLTAVLSVVLILGTWRYAAVVLRDKNTPSAAALPEIEFLNQEKLSDYELYVFDDTYFISLYNKYKILSPSRWNYHFFGSSQYDWDKNRELIHTILQDLQRHKTKFVLDCSDAWKNQNNKLFYPEWKKFLQDNYRLLMTDNSNRKLWRIQ